MDEIKNDPHLDFLNGYELEYYKLGLGTLIPRIWGPVKEEDRESVYQKAVAEKRKWEDVIGYKPKEDQIL